MGNLYTNQYNMNKMVYSLGNANVRIYKEGSTDSDYTYTHGYGHGRGIGDPNTNSKHNTICHKEQVITNFDCIRREKHP